MPRSFSHALVLAILLASCSGEQRLPVKGAITVGGAQLQYVRDGRGPPLLIVGSATYYPKAFSSNLREHFELIFVDGRHFVPSYHPPAESLATITLETFADDLEAIRAQLGIDRWGVLGHSIHAQIALAYASKYPLRTSHLILVAGVPYAFGEFRALADSYWQANASDERKRILSESTRPLDSLLAAAPPSRSFAVSYRARGALYWANPTYDATRVLEDLENGPAFPQLVAALPTGEQVRRTLAKLQVPTLVMLGKLDYAVPYQAWQPLVEGLSHVTYILLEHDSHNPQTESPGRFDQQLVEWYGNH